MTELGVAEAIVQKFALYHTKAAAVLDNSQIKGKFKKFISESNSGNIFRVYKNVNKRTLDFE
ncbi:MAG: DUF4180 domain-containing protein [Sporolactobacillus sp.]|uniref:DUF4180 domain-containing protein n=1 Tax=Sporolactobacillus sp. STSJ-5 TaxID=2965076 RepID=UPI00351CC4DD